MEISSHMDYLTVSYRSVKAPDEIFFLHNNMFDAVEEMRPLPHYDLAWRLACGAIFNTSENESQGSRLDLSGEPLQRCRDHKLSDAGILLIACDTPLKKRTTRMDYCWNIFDAGSVRHTVNHWMAEKRHEKADPENQHRKPHCITTFRKDPLGYVAHGSHAGQTAYFGSLKGDQLVRVYDKGAEMGLLNQALLRVELVTRAPHAGEFFGDAISSNLKAAARTRLLSVLDFPRLQWWGKAIYGQMTELGTIPRKLPKWQSWLNGQVHDSIKQHWELDENGDREFIIAWLKHLKKITNEP